MCIYFPDLLPICGCTYCRVCVDRELPGHKRPGSGFSTARAARVAALLDHRAFAPEIIARRIDRALEAPLLGRPAFRS